MLSLTLALLMCLTVSAVFVACKTEDTGEAPNTDGSDESTQETEAPQDLNQLEEPLRALEVFKLVDQNMTAVKTYAMDTELNMTGTMMGQNVSAKGLIETVCTNQNDVYAYYSKSNTTVHMKDLNTEVVVSNTEGFFDGRMFISEEANGVATKLYSSISAKDYMAFRESQDAMDDTALNLENLDLASADASGTRSCVQKDDGAWELSFSDFSDVYVKEFAKLVVDVFGGESDDYTLADVKLTMAVTSDFYCSEMQVEFLFEKKEGSQAELPVCSANVVYRDLGTASVKEVDLSDYKKIGDLRVYYILTNELDNYLENGGYFKLKLDNRTSFDSDNQRYVETAVGKIGVTDGKFFFDVKATGGGEQYKIAYSDGRQTITFEDNSAVSEDMVEAEAKAFIKGLLDPAALTLSNIADIKLTDAENGVYEIELISPDFSSLDETIKELRGTIENKSGSITLTIVDGRLVKYAYDATIEVHSYYGNLKVTVEATCNYSDDTAFE